MTRIIDIVRQLGGLKVAYGLDEFLDIFREEMARHCEFVLPQHGGPIGIMVKNRGDLFLTKLKRIIRHFELPSESLELLNCLEKSIHYHKILIKYDCGAYHADETKNGKLTFHLLCHAPIYEVTRIFYDLGIRGDVLRHISSVAETLGEDTVAFVSCALQKEDHQKFKLYFLQRAQDHRTGIHREHLSGVARILGLSSERSKKILDLHNDFFAAYKGDPFLVSVNFTYDKLLPTVKMDYFDIAPENCVKAIPEKEREKELCRIKEACRLVRNEMIPSIGIRFQEGSPTTMKYYLEYEPN